MKHRVNRMMTVAILTGGLLFAGTGVSEATFKDLNKDFLAKDEISYFVEHEIIKGNPDSAFSDVSKNHKVHKKNHPNKGKPSTLTKKEALELFTKAKNSYWYVVMGGDGKRNEATFTHNDMEYRYMAQSLNTMKKLKAYLGKTYTSEQVTALIKKLGIIERKGVLAQSNADGGSILNWKKATMKETSSTATTKKFTLSVPLGDTKEVETLQGELRYEKGKGWRVHSLETILNSDTPSAITSQQALQLFKESQSSYWYVVRGGDGKRNEATFTYKGKDYRYMANSLNTMEKLKAYLGKTYISEQVNALIKKLGIIEYKGVLAQPNADGGSRAMFEKATIKETSSTATTKKFTLNVPLDGDDKEVETLQGELRYEKGKGWRVYSLETMLNSDAPPAITSQQARSLFEEAKNSYWYVVMGGEGKRNEATFTQNDMEYRYMANSLNTMEKLKVYLGKTYTSEQVTTLIKKLGIIERKGVLAQPNADGGSRLMFEKATIKETASTETSKKFTLNVPLYGDGKEVETLQGELRYVKGKGWRVYSLETILNGDTPPAITSQQARSLFEEAKNSYWYVVMGGEGKRNDATFTYKGKDYRYMAESLNTMAKLKKYLGYYYTPDQQEKLIKDLGIIERKGVLAQPNADGGSILNWKKAKIKEISSSNQVKHFEIDVPIGESSDYEVLIGELRYVKDAEAWLVHRLEQRMSKSTK